LKALRFIHGGLELQTVAVPTPSPTEALIDVELAGICGTDLAIISGDYRLEGTLPVTLGHEIFGTLRSSEFAGKRNLPAGTRVASEINVSCGRCYLCSIGLRTHCNQIRTIGMDRDGGFAEAVVVPAVNLHAVPDSVSDVEAVFTEPLAAAIELAKMCPVEEGSRIAVLGCGRLGLLVIQVLKLNRPELLVGIGRAGGRKLDLAKALGADMAIATDQSSLEDLKAFTPESSGYDHVVDTTGSSEGLGLAVELVRPRGTVHSKSTHGLPINFDLTKAVVKEVRIQGSRCGPFEDALDVLSSKCVAVKEMVSNEFTLEDFAIAFASAKSKNSLKILFRAQ
jgi:alcohol dehydrogenase